MSAAPAAAAAAVAVACAAVTAAACGVTRVRSDFLLQFAEKLPWQEHCGISALHLTLSSSACSGPVTWLSCTHACGTQLVRCNSPMHTKKKKCTWLSTIAFAGTWCCLHMAKRVLHHTISTAISRFRLGNTVARTIVAPQPEQEGNNSGGNANARMLTGKNFCVSCVSQCTALRFCHGVHVSGSHEKFKFSGRGEFSRQESASARAELHVYEVLVLYPPTLL